MRGTDDWGPRQPRETRATGHITGSNQSALLRPKSGAGLGTVEAPLDPQGLQSCCLHPSPQCLKEAT